MSSNAKQKLRISIIEVERCKNYKGRLDFPDISLGYQLIFGISLSRKYSKSSQDETEREQVRNFESAISIEFSYDGGIYQLSDIGRIYPEYQDRLIGHLIDAALNLDCVRNGVLEFSTERQGSRIAELTYECSA